MSLPPPELYRFGEFTLHVSDGRLLRDGHPVALPPKPFEMLVYLVRAHGRVVPKQELLDALWPDTHVTEDGVVQCVVEIRRALADRARGSQFIETIPRRGYSFVAPLAAATAAAGDQLPGTSTLADVVPSATEPEPVAARAETAAAEAHAPALAGSPATSAAAAAPVFVRPTVDRRLGRMVPVGPWGIVFALFLLVVGMGLLAAWTTPGSADTVVRTQPAVAPGSVVVLPVDVVDASPDAAWSRAGLAELMRSELASSPAVSVVARHRVEARLAGSTAPMDDAAAITLAAPLAERVVVARSVRVEDRFTLTARVLHTATGRVEQTATVRNVSREGILDAVAELCRQLLPLWHGASGAAQPRAAAATQSLAAYQAYTAAVMEGHRGGQESLERAVAQLREATRIDPSFGQAYIALAMAQQTQRRWGYPHDDPADAVRRARALDTELPDRDRLLVDGLAAVFIDGQVSTALAKWARLRQLYPSFANEAGVPSLIADTCMSVGDWDRLILETADAADDPSVPVAERARLSSLLGRAYRRKGEFDRAMAHMRRAIEIWPSREGPAVNTLRLLLGRMYVDLGQIDAGVAEFRAVRQDPSANAINITDAAWGFYMAGLRDDARGAVEAAIAQQPSHGNAYHLRAWMAMADGRATTAADDFANAYERTPAGFGSPAEGIVSGDVAARYYQGVALQAAGNEAAAREVWRATLRDAERLTRIPRAPGNPVVPDTFRWHAHLLAAMTHARLGHIVDVPGRLEGDDATYFMQMARLRAAQGKDEEALRLLRRAFTVGAGDVQHVADDPNFARLHHDPQFVSLLASMRTSRGT